MGSSSSISLTSLSVSITYRLFVLLFAAASITSFLCNYSSQYALNKKQRHYDHFKTHFNYGPALWHSQHTIYTNNVTIPTISKQVKHSPSLQPIFTRYLDAICLQNGSYPSDCMQLLESMINISSTLDLSHEEIEILSQRIEYLNTPNHDHMAQPILYIHIPKTGGTGFGDWLQKHSGKKTAHVWIPDGAKPNMFDHHHFPNAKRNRRLVQKGGRRKKKKPFYPQVMYGHLAYGFDKMFLSNEEIQKLNKTPAEIIWKPRINYTYITVVRHPQTRVSSHYFYHKTGPKDENNKWTKNRNLFQWVGFFEESTECLVQFISGCHHRAWYNKEYRDILEPNLDPWPRREQDQSPDVFAAFNITEDQYKIARKHLLLMGWIGLTEHLSESVEQFKIFAGSKTKQGSKKANVGKKRRPNIEQNAMEKIMQLNQYDAALWELAYVMFLQQRLVIKYGYNMDLNEKQASAIHTNRLNNIPHGRGENRTAKQVHKERIYVNARQRIKMKQLQQNMKG